MFPNIVTLFPHAVALLILFSGVYSQQIVAPTYDPAPFSFIGTIDAMSLDGTSDPLSGGTLTVNGFKLVIPKNTLVTLPSITVAWSELFKNGDLNTPDLPLLGTVSWEATVFGNLVGGRRIVGLVYIAQEATQVLQGFITSIDPTTGHFLVGPDVECVLNDPLGRYYATPYTTYPLWSVDADNPSVRSSTGFPLCIPSSNTDPDCPLSNRPVDPKTKQYLTSYTYPDPAKVTAGGLDPRIMAPLAVGDYITFSGIRTPEKVIAVYSLEANLGIYTAPGTKPAYITVEEANYGIVDPNPNVETAETRAVGFATDPTTTVEWYAIDVDPCTGEESKRQLMVAQGSANAPVGKLVYRLGKVDASPATREIGFQYTNEPSPGPKGILAGRFIQPIFNFLFPELIAFGAKQVPLEFDLIPFLAKGSGPLEFGNTLAKQLDTPPIVGQLSPWPGNPVPAPVTCPPPGPVPPTTPPATPPTTPQNPPKDVITVTSAAAKRAKGISTTTATASSNNPAAQLFMAITGVDNVAPQKMTKLPNGQFQFSITTKGNPSSTTITSSLGGKPVTVAV